MLNDEVLDRLSETVLLRCPQLSLTTRIIGNADQSLRLWPLERRHGSTATPAVVIIDAMRTTASIPGLVGPGESLFFVEAAEGPGIPRFDVTGFLWRSGLSVIDVDRIVITAPDSDDVTDVVVGRARLTPERVVAAVEAGAGPRALRTAREVPGDDPSESGTGTGTA